MSQPDVQLIMGELHEMKETNTAVHAQMQSDMKELKEKTDEMYKIFQQGSWFIQVLKILGIVAIAVAGFLLTLKQLK